MAVGGFSHRNTGITGDFLQIVVVCISQNQALEIGGTPVE